MNGIVAVLVFHRKKDQFGTLGFAAHDWIGCTTRKYTQASAWHIGEWVVFQRKDHVFKKDVRCERGAPEVR